MFSDLSAINIVVKINMKAISILFVLAILPFSIRGDCILSLDTLSCKHTYYKNFVQSFYELSCLMDNLSSTLVINIEDSSFKQIDYFPRLFLVKQNLSITHLTIKNSSVEEISDYAFEELTNLEYLDLSYNKLKSVAMTIYLPSYLKVLHLNNNNISYFNGDFGELEYLDLSYNAITVIDFSNLYWIRRLNFNHNRVHTLKPIQKGADWKVEHFDLSHNEITTFSEEDLNVGFSYLDISYNKLTFILLKGGHKTCLNLSGNNVTELNVKSQLTIDVLNLSSSFLDISKTNVLPKYQLLLNDNKLGILNQSILKIPTESLKFNGYRPKIFMSNSSIEDIPPYYFEGLRTDLLNLSNNAITVLRNNVFFNSIIETLDLSNSGIERIQESAFENLRAKTIRLKGNELKIFDQVFIEEEVTELDLSYNKFESITTQSFGSFNSYGGLIILNLEHCLIERIVRYAFLAMNNLERLILSNNKLHVLETNTFSSLPIKELNLEGNKISLITKKAFNNLPNIKELNISNVDLIRVEPYAFYNLPKVHVVDLSYNNISVIPQHIFTHMKNLRTVHLKGSNVSILNLFSTKKLRIQTLTLSISEIFRFNDVFNSEILNLYIIDSKIKVLRNNSFGECYNLIELHFNNTSVLKIETGALNNLFNLKYLDSQRLFQFTKDIYEGTFKDLRSLKYLNLSGLSLQSLQPKAFIGLVSLETLLLNDNDINELRENTFFSLVSLKLLNLSNSNIETCDNKSFNGLKSLEILHLDNNNLLKIESEFLFGNLRNLLYLYLENNNIDSLHTKSFSNLKQLSQLHLQNNNLTEIPLGVFQDLTLLKVLNLSQNAVRLLESGHLSNLQSMIFLDLSHNQLVKLEHVDVFFSSKQLKRVWFDGNRLKQFDFKRFLANLRQVEYVGISFNKWKCETLSYIIEIFNNATVEYTPKEPVFDSDNIDGIGCIDICKFIHCFHENVEENLIY